jgi:hypothetical protein
LNFQARNEMFLSTFLNFSSESHSGTVFSLGFFNHSGLTLDWLPTIQTTLWQRFLELLKSQKYEDDVQKMVHNFANTVTTFNFSENLDAQKVGYDLKVYKDMSVLCVCIRYGKDVTEQDPERDSLCHAAANAYQTVSVHLSVAVANSTTYKSMWSKITNFAKQAVDSKTLQNKCTSLLKVLDQIKALSCKKQQLQILIDMSNSGLTPSHLHRSLLAANLQADADMIQKAMAELSDTFSPLLRTEIQTALEEQWVSLDGAALCKVNLTDEQTASILDFQIGGFKYDCLQCVSSWSHGEQIS